MAQFTEWCDALEDALSEPFPEDVVQQKRKGGTAISFVAWHHYVRKLNDLVGAGWSIGTPIITEVGGKMVVALPVTILGTTRINFGSEDEDKDDYGDAATNAWAQAVKRTLALFGMGLYMYDKTRPQPRQAVPQARQTPREPSKPIATKLRRDTLHALVSALKKPGTWALLPDEAKHHVDMAKVLAGDPEAEKDRIERAIQFVDEMVTKYAPDPFGEEGELELPEPAGASK